MWGVSVTCVGMEDSSDLQDPFSTDPVPGEDASSQKALSRSPAVFPRPRKHPWLVRTSRVSFANFWWTNEQRNFFFFIPQINDIIKIQAFIRANKARDDYKTLSE